MTPLDQIFAEAKENEGKRNQFYSLLITSDLYIPTHDAPSDNGTDLSSGKVQFNPIIINDNGSEYLMIFDTREKLYAWAGKPVGHVCLPGYTLAEISINIHWTLNPGTEYTKVLVPGEIAWLKQTISDFKNKSAD
jgi:hypothetical protein